MAFVKTYWVSLLSGAVALVACVVLILGLSSDSVQQDVQAKLRVVSEIDGLVAGAKNEGCIAAELQQRQKFETEFKNALAVAERINKRAPLIDGVFPQPAQLELSYRFQEAYRDKLYELPRELRAGDLPNPQEVADQFEILTDLARRKFEQEKETAAATGAAPTAPGPLVPPRAQPGYYPGGFPGMSGFGRGPMGGRGGDGFTPNVSEVDARERANVKKARAIRMYVSSEQQRASFHVSPMLESNKPTPRGLWHAQVALWVQQDIVNAIARLNDEAAKQIGEKNANVTNMPVKRLVSTRVLGYLPATGAPVLFETRGGGGSTGVGMMEGISTSFTNRKSDDQFDVIRFTVTVVVDNRDLLRLVDAFTKVNFYQLVGASYAVVNAATEQGNGYYYGGDPVVQATLDFEGYMARKVYAAQMPAEVREELGIKRQDNQQ